MQPPSTRSAAPVVPDHSGLHVGDQRGDLLGRLEALDQRRRPQVSKNSFSKPRASIRLSLAQRLDEVADAADLVGPGSTLLTVMAVPASDSASPRATASWAVLVMP